MTQKTDGKFMPVGNIVQTIKQYGVSGVLIVILMWGGTKLYESISQVQVELSKVQIQIIEMKHKLVNQAQIKRWIDDGIEKHEYKFHGQATNYLHTDQGKPK